MRGAVLHRPYDVRVEERDELHTLAGADDLHISPYREDGVTCRTPTVAEQNSLFVAICPSPAGHDVQTNARDKKYHGNRLPDEDIRVSDGSPS